MAELAIPKEQRPLLNRIRTISEDSFNALVGLLEGKIAPSFTGTERHELEELKDLVTELYSVRAYFHMTVEQFAAATATALQETEAFHSDQVGAFKQRLQRLLTIPSVSISQKAESLKAEYEHIFSTARILTDARPVYSADLSKPPTAALIIHTLRVSYLDETSRNREIYFAMDDDDIAMLRELLDRAKSKSKSLESVFSAANIPVMNTGKRE